MVLKDGFLLLGRPLLSRTLAPQFAALAAFLGGTANFPALFLTVKVVALDAGGLGGDGTGATRSGPSTAHGTTVRALVGLASGLEVCEGGIRIRRRWANGDATVVIGPQLAFRTLAHILRAKLAGG